MKIDIIPLLKSLSYLELVLLQKTIKKELETRTDSDSLEFKKALGSDYDINNIDMDVKLYYILKHQCGISDIRELTKFSIPDLLKKRGIGKKTIEQIETILDKFDLRLNYP